MAGKKRQSPFDDALASLSKGLGQVKKAAGEASRELKREIDKGGVVKAVEDSGREIVRAATNVATQVGAGLQSWGQRTQDGLEGRPQNPASTPPPPQATSDDWPKTRDEFEERFGKVAGDWPRSAEEFERRFGFPPGKKPVGPTARDPGFRIATDDRK